MTDPRPCPHCGKMHAPGDYGPRPDLAKKPLGNLLVDQTGRPHEPGSKYHGVRSGTPFAPPDVRCDCGALLRHVVPIFMTNANGYEWRRVDPPAKPTDPEPETPDATGPGVQTEGG
jgi:hypothetical protein